MVLVVLKLETPAAQCFHRYHEDFRSWYRLSDESAESSVSQRFQPIPRTRIEKAESGKSSLVSGKIIEAGRLGTEPACRMEPEYHFEPPRRGIAKSPEKL